MTVETPDQSLTGALPRIERCPKCNHAWLIRRGFCPQCGSRNTTIEEVPGSGQVDAVTVVHRATQPSAIGPAPYGIALVTLDAEPAIRLMALTAETVSIGDRVQIRRHGDNGAPYLATPTPGDAATTD